MFPGTCYSNLVPRVIQSLLCAVGSPAEAFVCGDCTVEAVVKRVSGLRCGSETFLAETRLRCLLP
jgi:hypothetical protein